LNIPYDCIDADMRELIRAMNQGGYIITKGCCIGHGMDLSAEVIFEVLEQNRWHNLMLKLLDLNQNLQKSNIDIFQWHRLRTGGEHYNNWLLKISAHPRTSENSENEDERILKTKQAAIKTIIGLLDSF